MGIYEKLGLQTIINAHDTLTKIGGSRMPSSVLKAMAEASESFIDICELNHKIGERIAALTRNEAAYVTSGASSGLLIAAAACVTDGDPYRISKLPDTSLKGMKDEIIIHKCQRNGYDLVLSATGAKLMEIGDADQTMEWELEGVISERTAAFFYFAASTFQKGALPLEKVIEICRKHGVPVVVDAAAQLPPVENLWRYTELGANMVIFSGGKTLRGPQCSGVILGEKKWIDICARIGSPHHTIGRPAKIGREEMVGLLAAIERYVQLDHKALNDQYEAMVSRIITELENCPGVQASRLFPGPVGQAYPRAKITLSNTEARDEMIARMRQGDECIEIGCVREESCSVYISPLNLEPEEFEIVIRKLRDILGS